MNVLLGCDKWRYQQNLTYLCLADARPLQTSAALSNSTWEEFHLRQHIGDGHYYTFLPLKHLEMVRNNRIFIVLRRKQH